ncbi:type I restriction enzyme, S subunit [Gammaproteobacteria bacterium]
MSFPRYPKYKASGVEWLGDVPEHWAVKRLKHNARLLTEKTDRRDHPVGLENIEGWSGRFIPTETAFEGEGIAFDAGDILFGKLRPYLAKAYLAQSSGEAVGDFYVMRPAVGIDARFAQYQILNREFIAIVDGSTFGTKMPRASWEFVGGMKLTLPPLVEQTAIAEFLDRETGKIDGLVAEQRRLMELLKEKRQAVISHAVTQGLNPHAPMKPSGIEWLGDVPEHWEVKRLKHVLARNGLVRGPFGGDLKKEIFQASGIKVYEQKNAIYRDYQLGESYVSAGKYSEMLRFRVTPGDYIMSCSGTIGKTYRLPESAPDGIINQALLIIRFSNNVTFQYADWIFDSEFFVKQILDNSQGGAMKNLVGMDVFTSISLPVPPLNEQLQIAQYLDAESSKFDILTAEAPKRNAPSTCCKNAAPR